MADDEEITSAKLDGLLDQAETLRSEQPSGSTQVRLYVAVDADMLQALEHRAARAGTAISDAATEALRAGLMMDSDDSQR